MVRSQREGPRESKRYDPGFHLHRSGDLVMLEGYDAGASFCSAHDPMSGTTSIVISDTSEGRWPIKLLDEWLSSSA
jgi:hypothetical protein